VRQSHFSDQFTGTENKEFGFKSRPLTGPKPILRSQTLIRMATVWVNILWLISLVLSLRLVCDTPSTMGMSVHRNTQTAEVLRHRARVCLLLLVGREGVPNHFHGRDTSYTPPPLRILILWRPLITFHMVHKRVAIAVDVAVGFSGLAYIAMSIVLRAIQMLKDGDRRRVTWPFNQLALKSPVSRP
jgi:hypothetical protein